VKFIWVPTPSLVIELLRLHISPRVYGCQSIDTLRFRERRRIPPEFKFEYEVEAAAAEGYRRSPTVVLEGTRLLRLPAGAPKLPSL